MFGVSAYPAPVLRWRQGPVMSGFLTFMDRYRDEAACIAALAELRWPNGFICAGCAGRLAYQLAARPRVFECAGCGRQHSVTAGTVFHRTRTPLRKWFAAAWLIGQDKRGVSALFLARELALRYDTAWLMAHKLRHVLSERPEYPLEGLIEIDESYYGGRGKPESRGRGLTDPNKRLNGTFHGVSAKHLPRYAREWNYRFNRRRRISDLTDFLLRRAATRPTITYRQLVDGAQINGALPASTG